MIPTLMMPTLIHPSLCQIARCVRSHVEAYRGEWEKLLIAR